MAKQFGNQYTKAELEKAMGYSTNLADTNTNNVNLQSKKTCARKNINEWQRFESWSFSQKNRYANNYRCLKKQYGTNYQPSRFPKGTRKSLLLTLLCVFFVSPRKTYREHTNYRLSNRTTANTNIIRTKYRCENIRYGDLISAQGNNFAVKIPADQLGKIIVLPIFYSANVNLETKTAVITVKEYNKNENLSKYFTADEYLSGNVREKLAIARNSAKVDSSFNINVEALEKVQPEDLTASEISVRLGSTWLPVDIVQQFIYEFLNTPGYAKSSIIVHYSRYTGEWSIDGKSYDRSNVKAYNTYGSARINAYRIIEETLNLKDVRIFDYVEDIDGNRKAVLNKKETAIAQSKQELIKQGFQDWVWADPERRERLCKLYNEKFNSIRPREYDGSHIVFSGMNPEITLREHQRNAVAHILYGGNTLLAHAVGAGKTFEMVAAAQESKRLGLCNKSLFVVPNHLTEQWASEYLQLYPSANILVATKKDFETKNRKRFCGRIATGDYDAVIIGHSQFEKIPMSIERQRASLEQQENEITEGLAELKRNRGENFSIKQLERAKKSIRQKIEKLNDQSRKDDVVTFEELGVDRIFVDESHYYKNLFLYTKMRNVGGIAQTEAQKSSDLFMKCRYLDEITGGRGTVFATGTPISNSMVELYTIQRYLQYDTVYFTVKNADGAYLKAVSKNGKYVYNGSQTAEARFMLTNGKFELTELPTGKYTITEINNAEGYLPKTQVKTITVTKDATASAEFVNKVIVGNVTLTKVDEDYPENKLTGAIFTVYKSDKKTVVGTLKETETGVYSLEGLVYGEYYVQETKAPEYFVRDTNFYYFQIVNDGETVEVSNDELGKGTFINSPQKGEIKIVKTSYDNKVEGIHFEVTGKTFTGQTFSKIYTTDKDGIIRINDLRAGEYNIHEVNDSASAGYLLPDDKQLTIDRDGAMLVANMHNSKLPDNPPTGANEDSFTQTAVVIISMVMMSAAVVLVFPLSKRKRKR